MLRSRLLVRVVVVLLLLLLGGVPLAGCGGWVVTLGVAADDGGKTPVTSRDASVDGSPDAGQKDVVVPVDGGTPDVNAPIDARKDVDTEPDGSTTCPITPPVAGKPCSDLGQACEYGSSASVACNNVWTCTASGWSTLSIAQTCKSGTCPTTYVSASAGAMCAPSGLDCAYTQGTCICAAPSGPLTQDADTVHWQCFGLGAGCPETRPRIGSTCADSTNGTTCNYGACAADGVELTCEDGNWTEVTVACPS